MTRGNFTLFFFTFYKEIYVFILCSCEQLRNVSVQTCARCPCDPDRPLFSNTVSVQTRSLYCSVYGYINPGFYGWGLIYSVIKM
jgi:hypothetical protein